ncbi:MAG: hypothetical protein ACYDHN_04710 [Solirubrobacteraceae bacterium]
MPVILKQAPKRTSRSAAVLLAGGAALILGACGGATHTTAAAARLQREDLVLVARTLSGAQPEVAVEVTATKAAWPLVAHGLPADVSSISRSAIATAEQRAARLKLPALFQERRARSITGPGAGMATLFRSYAVLADRGWTLIGSAIDQIERGSPTAARFARANISLYIESVYDSHFDLAQIGKQLLAGYKKLGGAAAFGTSLTEAEVGQLAAAYSESSDRLHPHAVLKIGS